MLPPAAVTPPRFVIAPTTVRWQSELKQLHIRCENSLDWRGAPPLPPPPAPRCWLLPATDAVALAIARHRAALAALGWRLLTCDEAAVRRLSDKAEFHSTAVALGLASHLPTHYSSAAAASYPCILKGAEGEHGRAVRIVQSAEEATERTARAVADGDGDRWLLQELIRGHVEYSASLLVAAGTVAKVLCVRYVYDRDAYVWPHNVNERKEQRSVAEVAPEHLAVMSALVTDYTGVCNFNYKLRDADGSLALLECNTRVGGDLAADAPRNAAKEFFEALDATPPSPPPPDDIAAPPTAAAAPPPVTPSAAATAPPPSTPPAKSKAGAPPKTSLLYLSESRDETPRYRKAKDAPDWVDTKCKSFLLLGWDTPALKPQAPPPPPTTPLARRPSSARAAATTPSPRTRASPQRPGSRPSASLPSFFGIGCRATRTSLATCGPPPETTSLWPLARLRSDEEAARWRIDPNRLVVLGFSAGAHLAAQAIGPPVGPPAAALVLVYPAEEDGGGGYPGLCPGGKDEVRTTLAAEDARRRRARRLGGLPCTWWALRTTGCCRRPSMRISSLHRSKSAAWRAVPAAEAWGPRLWRDQEVDHAVRRVAQGEGGRERRRPPRRPWRASRRRWRRCRSRRIILSLVLVRSTMSHHANHVTSCAMRSVRSLRSRSPLSSRALAAARAHLVRTRLACCRRTSPPE